MCSKDGVGQDSNYIMEILCLVRLHIGALI